MSPRLFLFDTTLRDGEQTPGVNLGLMEKRELARALERLGVDMIEAGFAASSRGDAAAVAAVAADMQACGVCSLARCVKGDIDAAAEALKEAKHPRIHVFIASSPIHMEHKLKMSPEKVLERAAESVAYAKKLCGDIEFSAEDASRSDEDFLCRLFEAVIRAGATTINIPDTVGYASPREFGALISAVQAGVPNIHKAVISVHCHNDLGLAVANSLEAVISGARQIECTINGMGERAGNAALEEIVMGVTTRRDFYGVEHGIATRQLYRTCKMTESLMGVDLQRNKAVVGENAFLHESGIHQHGMLANSATYEIMNPESIGVPKSGMVLGKLSGRHAFAEHVKEMGYDHLSEEEITGAFAKFKDLCDRKREVTDLDIEALLGSENLEIPGVFTLDTYQVYSGNRMTSTATIKMSREGVDAVEASVGDGPIHASYQAIERMAGIPLTLENYVIKAVGEGIDALGDVTVRVRSGNSVAVGKGVSTDIIEASILSFIAAVNRLIADPHREDPA